MLISPRLLPLLRCPITGSALHEDGERLVNADGSQAFEVVDGIPLLMPIGTSGVQPLSTHSGYDRILEENRQTQREAGQYDQQTLDSFLDNMIVPTCGNLFHGVHLRQDYPLGDMPDFSDGPVVEIGCNWGRWSIDGAMKGASVIGMDIHLKSLLCAKHLARRLSPDNEPMFVLGDARHMPFRDGVIGGVFSYSVIQHFSKANAAAILGEVKRVLKPNGISMIQMAHAGGIRYRSQGPQPETSEFDVRRYTKAELETLFERQIGPSRISVDCFLGLNVHMRDWRFVPTSKKPVLLIAELLRLLEKIVRPLQKLSDSLWVRSERRA